MTASHLEQTSAFLDGELDAGAGADADAEAHIAGCAECQALVEAAAAASEALRAPGLRFAAPASLRARVAQSLDAEDRAMSRPRTLRSFWTGAASGAAAAGLAAAVALVLVLPPQPQTLAVALADAHVAALSSGRLTEAPFTTHHTLKPWFAGRAPVSPPVVDFSAEGYPLIGGRVEQVAGETAAVLAYGHGAHRIDLYVWADRGGTLPGLALRHGYRVQAWNAGDLDFAAVGDLQAGEFDQFVRLIRSVRE